MIIEVPVDRRALFRVLNDMLVEPLLLLLILRSLWLLLLLHNLLLRLRRNGLFGDADEDLAIAFDLAILVTLES